MRPLRSGFLLAIIVFAQFAGTSLWFAGNAVISSLLPHGGIASLTSLVQFGFIAGTLVFSLLAIADKFPASVVFFVSCVIAAAANWILSWFAGYPGWLYSLRFITGFFLAGIYPVGMKISADCFPGKLGRAMGLLVGALVLGTAFPHIMSAWLSQLNWKDVLHFTSLLAVSGGLLVYLLVPRVASRIPKWNLRDAFTVFKNSSFRSAAFGYFGHMWELYAFWAFIPLVLEMFSRAHSFHLNIAFWSFLIIGTGSISCIAGGMMSKRLGSRKIALYSLVLSAACCLLTPFLLNFPAAVFLFILMLWGATVVSDSPQFSTLVAQSAPPEQKGTALTLVTCIGFSITIASIQLLAPAFSHFGIQGLWILLPGPLFGINALRVHRRSP
jgi:MFS family permease